MYRKPEGTVMMGIVINVEDKAIVDKYIQNNGLSPKRGFSAALRQIIREWSELKSKETN